MVSFYTNWASKSNDGNDTHRNLVSYTYCGGKTIFEIELFTCACLLQYFNLKPSMDKYNYMPI